MHMLCSILESPTGVQNASTPPALIRFEMMYEQSQFMAIFLKNANTAELTSRRLIQK